MKTIILRLYKSRSRPGEKYQVYQRRIMPHDVGANITSDQVGKTLPQVFCTCPGFLHHGHCWHVARTIEQLAQRYSV